MAIIGHIDVLTPQSVAGKAPAEAQQTIDNNDLLAESEGQNIEERVEHSFSSLFSEGLLTVPSVTISGSSLQITFGAFNALLGVYIAYAGGTATVLANQTSQPLYFPQNQTFTTTLPTTKTYFIIGTYTSNGSGVTSFTLTNKLLIPTLYTLTGSVALNIPDDVDYTQGYLDHSATVLFAIDGKLKLTVSDSDVFTVEELYPGAMIDQDSSFAHDPLHQRTDGGFWYKISRSGSYTYAAYPNCTLTYTRTGLRLAV